MEVCKLPQTLRFAHILQKKCFCTWWVPFCGTFIYLNADFSYFLNKLNRDIYLVVFLLPTANKSTFRFSNIGFLEVTCPIITVSHYQKLTLKGPKTFLRIWALSCCRVVTLGRSTILHRKKSVQKMRCIRQKISTTPISSL